MFAQTKTENLPYLSSDVYQTQFQTVFIVCHNFLNHQFFGSLQFIGDDDVVDFPTQTQPL